MEKSSATTTETKPEEMKIEAPAAQPTPQKVRSSWIVGGISIAILLCGSSFLLGMMIGSHQHRGPVGATTSGGRSYGPMMGTYRRAGIRGTVTAISGSSITVQESNGATKTYVIDANTLVRKAGVTGAVSDITTGTEVSVRAVDPSAANPIAASIMIIVSSSANTSSNQSQAY